MFTWDGSEVTDLIKKAIIEEGVYEKSIYWRLTFINEGNKSEVCMLRRIYNVIPCLIDEIKPIFNLEKIGTHWIRHDNKKFLLLRVKLDKEEIIHDLTLNLLPFDEKYENLNYEIRKIFAFRDMLGMSRNTEKSIILRKINFVNYNYILPISFYDANMEPSTAKTRISQIILEKWFNDISVDEIIKKMLKVKYLDEITEVLYTLRKKLENVVQRCDSNHIIFVDEIIAKIGTKLQSILKTRPNI